MKTPHPSPLAKLCCGAALSVAACQIDPRTLVEQPLGAPQNDAGAGGESDGGSAFEQAGAGGAHDGNPSIGGGVIGESGAGGTLGLGGAHSATSGGTVTGITGGNSSGGSKSTSAGGSIAGGGVASGGIAGAKASSGGTSNRGGTAGTSGGTGGVGGAANGGKAGASAVSCPDLDQNHVPDCSETLAKDATFEPPFNPSQSNWKLDSGMNATWDAMDAGGGSSGSLLLTNATVSTESLSQLGVSQCLSATPNKNYRAVAQSYAQATQGGGFARISITFYAQSGCSGAPLIVNVSPLDGTTNSWRALEITAAQAPSAATSLLLRLEVLKLSTTPSSAVHFDNVLLKSD